MIRPGGFERDRSSAPDCSGPRQNFSGRKRRYWGKGFSARHRLGGPTRCRLFRYIVDASGPVGVGELTDYVGLNHNATRQHLAVLKDAGLVTEEVENRDRPGRPRLMYRQHPEAAGSWGTPGGYVWLAKLLSDAIRRKLEPRHVPVRSPAFASSLGFALHDRPR